MTNSHNACSAATEDAVEAIIEDMMAAWVGKKWRDAFKKDCSRLVDAARTPTDAQPAPEPNEAEIEAWIRTLDTEQSRNLVMWVERGRDAEADALRLHREKMEMYERAIQAEAKLAAHECCSAGNECELRECLSGCAQILDVVKQEWSAENAWTEWDQSVRDSITAAVRVLNEPQPVARPPIALGDMVYMNDRSPYFQGWKGVSFKVVSLRIEPDGKLWASVIEGEQRHRGNGVYDAETTDVDAEYLSPLSERG